MDSEALKNKKHWNSFTTEFFLPPEFVVSQIEEHGSVQVWPISQSPVRIISPRERRAQIDRNRYEEVLKRPLACHKCRQSLKTIPALKSHIVNCRWADNEP